MNDKDWYECGQKIGDLVQSAIDSKNFQQLNKAITDTINQTVDSVQQSIYKDNRQNGKGNGSGTYRYEPTHREAGNAYADARSRAGAGDLFDMFTGKSGKKGGGSGGESKPGNMKGVFSMVAGYGMAIISGVIAVVMLMLRWFTGFAGFGFSAILFAVLAAIFAIVGAKGGGYRARLKQVERYLEIMGTRDTITVKELAAASGKSEKEVKKELKEMISDGMFASGAYMDDQDTTLMTSREAYRQYQETMRAYEERKAAEEKQAAYQSRYTQGTQQSAGDGTETINPDLSEETAQILREGHEFIRHIHACNDAIPGEEMTQKLSRLEQVVTKIFDQVEKNPSSAPDLHRMMSYYLPVTRKLVDAYVELGDSGVGGENINKTRQEIEMSLDTINNAFETLLDSFYQDTAWDISSDISAMKTMMARDGLTGGGDFQRTREVSRDLNQAGGNLQFGEGSGAVATGGGAGAAAAAPAPAPSQAVGVGGGAAAAAYMEEEQ